MIQFFTLDNINEIVLKAYSVSSRLGVKIIDDKVCTGSSILEGQFYHLLELIDVVESRKDFDTNDDDFQRIVLKLYSKVEDECLYYNSTFIDIYPTVINIVVVGNFIQNQFGTPQNADFWISGSGKIQGKLSVSTTPTDPTDVLRLQDIGGLIPSITAANGLNIPASTNRVELGGNLTKTTVINTAGNFFFAVGNAGSGSGGSTQILPNGASLAYRAADGGINKIQFNGLVGGGFDNSIIIDDALVNMGAQYAGDYEANFVPRSLVTKQYVDGFTVSSGNGLHTDAGVIKLGGVLTEQTTINGISSLIVNLNSGEPTPLTTLNALFASSELNITASNALDVNNFGQSSTLLTRGDKIQHITTGGTNIANSVTGLTIFTATPSSLIGTVVISASSSDGSVQQISIGDVSMTVTDSTHNIGLINTGNYEPNFVPRSLITKQYADALDANNFKLTGAGTNIVTRTTTFNSGTVNFNGDIAANTNLYINPGGNGLQLNSGAVATWVNGDNTSRYFVRNVATSHYDSVAGLSISEYPFLNGGISIIGNNIKDDDGKIFLKTGDAIAPTELAVTNLYKETGWNNFNDFTAQGNYTLVNGNIHITALQADTLVTNYVTSLSDHTQSYTYRATNGLSNAAGVRFGIKTINIVSAAGFQFWFDEVTRKINVFNVSTSATTTSASTLSGYTAGDIITISAAYTNPTIIFTVKNQTTGFSITYSGSSLISMNRGNLAIIAQNTTVAYDIQNITLSTNYKYGGNLFIGDSIDNGSLATPGNGYTFQLNGQIQAGNGDYTVGVIAGLAEIIKLKPETAYVKVGTNDAFLGIWQTNIVIIVNTLQNAGIRVVLLSPPPRNTVDMTPYLTFLQAQFPSQTIDLFTPLKGAGTGLNATYDSGDGIHPNQVGHNLLASTISSNPLWHVAVYTKIISTDIFASRITDTVVVPGYYNGLSTFKVRADGRIENATNLGVQTNLGAMYYTTGGKIGVSSQVTINGSAVVANTFYGNSTWAATSQGTNFLSFLTAGNSNLVARMFNSGGMVIGVGLSADPGTNTLSVGGGVIAARFQGQSTASLTSVSTNLVQIATQSNANVVARHFDSGGATVGIGLTSDPGANNLQVGSKLGVGSATIPTARFHATVGGTTVAGTAPMKFTSGALMTTPEVGAFEFLTDGLYFTQTTGVTRQQIAYLASPVFTGTPTLPTGTIGVTQSAGNNSTALATTAFVLANSLSNPMTTLGDVIYGGASGIATRLAGNTTTNKRFLTSTGNGTISAAPAYFDLFATSNVWTSPVNIFPSLDVGFITFPNPSNFISVNIGVGSGSIPHSLVLYATNTAGTVNQNQTFQDDTGTIALTKQLAKTGFTNITPNGSTTVFNIPHGLGSNPSSFAITFSDATDSNLSLSKRTKDSTNLIITCNVPPIAGPAVTIYWQVWV